MAVTNYGELKTAVVLHVAEDITSVVEDLVTFAQDYLSLHVRHRKNTIQTDLSPISGEFTIPADFKWPRRVVEKSSLRRSLEFITPEVSDQKYPTRPAGLGVNYTIVGATLRVYPTVTNDIELTYFSDFGVFSSDGDTDWLLTKSPLLYLRVCQLMAADYLKDDTEYQKYAAISQGMIDELNSESDMADTANAGIAFTGVVV